MSKTNSKLLIELHKRVVQKTGYSLCFEDYFVGDRFHRLIDKKGGEIIKECIEELRMKYKKYKYIIIEFGYNRKTFEYEISFFTCKNEYGEYITQEENYFLLNKPNIINNKVIIPQ